MSKETKILVMLGMFIILVSTWIFFASTLSAQTFKVRSWSDDKWNSTALAGLNKIGFNEAVYDKPAHSLRGIIVVKLAKTLFPKGSYFNENPELFAVLFSFVHEMNDGRLWRRTGGVEPKDFIAEVGGIAFSWGYSKLPKDAQIFGLPLVAWGFYNLIKVQ